MCPGGELILSGPGEIGTVGDKHLRYDGLLQLSPELTDNQLGP